MAEEPQSIGEVFSASLPAVIAAGMFGIGAMLINIQIHSARMDASVQQLVQAIEELKTDSKAQLQDLDRRVRQLEIRR